MIELGLARIARLLPASSSLPWKAIHIAGTNGKGSIAGYLSHVLAAGGVRCGAFTSPHLVDRWDCITINNHVVRESLFRRVEDQIKERDRSLNVGASEFELLTATAFEIFTHQGVDVGVVEVGMGGRLDATNVLENVLVSVIAKIGYDHQAILGKSIEEIAREKAGILRSGVPCVVDGSNAAQVRDVIQAHAAQVGTSASFVRPADAEQLFPGLHQRFEDLDLEPHQRSNLSCALLALREKWPHICPRGVSLQTLLPSIPPLPRPGRLQEIDLRPLLHHREKPILLDGAHNPQSASVLASYVDQKLRSHGPGPGSGPGSNVTWVVAASQGKDIAAIMSCMIKPGDKVAAVRFGQVEGMPWVRSVDAEDLRAALHTSIPGIGETRTFGHGELAEALRWASEVEAGNPLVIAGSLYLVSDVLRLQREAARVS